MHESLAPVLIVSGPHVSVKDRSVWHAVRKQAASFRASSGAWLDVTFKLTGAEHLLALRRFRGSAAYCAAPYREAVDRYFADARLFDPPELAEVVLATLLEAEGLPYRAATFGELYEDEGLRRRLLEECGCVLASTTLLRDLSELESLVAPLRRPGNRVVVGGALATLLAPTWPGLPSVDLVAAGPGEPLVPVLARWIRSGYRDLEPPPGGRIETVGGTPILRAGPPPGRSLDGLPTPDWRLAERLHGRRFPVIHHESVRGCPFRCAFCSYPYLFDDTVCRRKSAARVAEEWGAYARQGVTHVSCLDSTFTHPRERVAELCERLLADGTRLQWICYGRADDLADPALCRLMARAGCLQVQVGVESGSPEILRAMNKRCSPQAAVAALGACREAGISTFVTVIVGFPGETPATVRETYALLREARPDFAYPTPLTTRVETIPMLTPAGRAALGLRTAELGRSAAPYWRHATMSCEEAAHWQRSMLRWMIDDRVALDSSLFYQGMLSYRLEDREALLDFQRDVARAYPLLRRVFGAARYLAGRRLERDVERVLGAGARSFPVGSQTLEK